MNAFENENFSLENDQDLSNNRTNLNRNSMCHSNGHQPKRKENSWKMFFSLTFHSLGIIFGDMYFVFFLLIDLINCLMLLL